MAKTMARILIVSHPASPFAREQALAARQAGHHIFWLAAQEATLPGVTAFALPRWLQRSWLLRAFAEPVLALFVLRRVRPDIVHVFYAMKGLMTFLLIRAHPLVVSLLGGDVLPDQAYHGIYAFFVRLLLNHADRILSKSDFMDAALARIGDYRAKLERVPWGVDLEVFNPRRDVARLRRRWEIPDNDLVFFDPRAARPFYNKHIILEAFAKYLQNGGPSATLLVSEFLAEPDYMTRQKQKARRWGVAHKVRFVGAIPYHEMPDYYALADVTISVPPSDGLPQTIYEAFAAESLLVTGDLPQYRGIVEHLGNALLVPVGDAEALRAALLWAATHPEDQQRLVKAARAYVRAYADLRVQIRRINQIYRELLEDPHARSG